MQVGLHSEPQNIWLDAGTRQPDISSLHHEPVAPLSGRGGRTLCGFQLLGPSFLLYLKRTSTKVKFYQSIWFI